MSMKIYTAYRLKNSKDLWEFVRDVRRKGARRVRGLLEERFQLLYGSLLVRESPEYTTALRMHPDNAEKAMTLAADLYLSHAYRDQASKHERNIWDFDVSIAIREYKGRLYLIPNVGAGSKGALDFLNRDKRLEDFSYWDNTDKPARISTKEWNQRRVVWEQLTASYIGVNKFYLDNWNDYLVVDICSNQTYWTIKPISFKPPVIKP